MIGWQQSAKSHGSSQTKSKEDNSQFALELNASFNQTNRLHKNVLSSFIDRKSTVFLLFRFHKTVQHYSEYFLYTQQCLHAVLVSIYLWKSKWKGSAGFFTYTLSKRTHTTKPTWFFFLKLWIEMLHVDLIS